MQMVIAKLAAVGIGTYYVRYYVLHAAVLAVIAILVVALRRRLPAWLRVTVLGIVAFTVIRLVFFDNPVALRFYMRHLAPNAVGLRQFAVLELDVDKYSRNTNTARLANLAVGSSQVGAIFSHWVSDPPQPLKVYSMAGMKTLDYVLYEDAIAAYNPARVILYLSAFDLTAGPELYSLPLAPARPLEIRTVVGHLRSSGASSAELDGPIHQFVASQLFPEYRYSFVFKGFLKPWFDPPGGGAVTSRPVRDQAEPVFVRAAWSQGAAQKDTLDAVARQHIAEFISYYQVEWLDYNLGFLKDFVAFCRERGIQIVIAEGQISPLVQSGKVDALNAMVRSRFAELETQFSNVTFLPRSEIYTFVASDYQDLTHVVQPAAMEYTRRLSSYLAPQPLPAMLGECGLAFLSGWYGRENDGAGWLRWSDGTGTLLVTARTAADLALDGEMISLVRPNAVRVLVDGREVASVKVDDPAWAFHPLPSVRLHLNAGQTAVIAFVGQAAPAQQSTEPRALTIALKDLKLTRTDKTLTCDLNPDGNSPARGVSR